MNLSVNYKFLNSISSEEIEIEIQFKSYISHEEAYHCITWDEKEATWEKDCARFGTAIKDKTANAKLKFHSKECEFDMTWNAQTNILAFEKSEYHLETEKHRERIGQFFMDLSDFIFEYKLIKACSGNNIANRKRKTKMKAKKRKAQRKKDNKQKIKKKGRKYTERKESNKMDNTAKSDASTGKGYKGDRKEMRKMKIKERKKDNKSVKENKDVKVT